MTNPVLVALAQARMREAPMFVRWCELNGACPCPAAPSAVARFVTDCASLGVERLWPAVQQISKMHALLGLADPTLGNEPTAAIGEIAGLTPPRCWPKSYRERFRSLPYDLQTYVASHEAQRERALRRAQNEAASLRKRIAALESSTRNRTENGDKTNAGSET